MRVLMYLVALILLLGWAIGFFLYSAAGLIHILIILAVISALVGLLRRN